MNGHDDPTKGLRRTSRYYQGVPAETEGAVLFQQRRVPLLPAAAPVRNLLLIGFVSSCLVTATGCTLTKTENPLTPTVAGPLPGVNITAPNPIQPRDGQRIPNDAQPVMLMLDNATSNSVRPFSYLIEVATDAGFANKVFTQDGVAPVTNGRTTFRLPTALPSGKSYWWRAKAKDGANDGPYSPSANFEIIVPVDLPGAGTDCARQRRDRIDAAPTFSWNNAARVRRADRYDGLRCRSVRRRRRSQSRPE